MPTTVVSLGETDQGIAGAALSANRGVKWDSVTPGNIIYAGSGDKIAGVIQDDFALNATAMFYRGGRGNRMLVSTSGTVVAGDYIKMGANGQFVSDGTSGSTALSVNTVGQLQTSPDTNGNAFATLY